MDARTPFTDLSAYQGSLMSLWRIWRLLCPDDALQTSFSDIAGCVSYLRLRPWRGNKTKQWRTIQKGHGMWRTPNQVQFEHEEETVHDREDWTQLDCIHQCISKDFIIALIGRWGFFRTVCWKAVNLRLGHNVFPLMSWWIHLQEFFHVDNICLWIQTQLALQFLHVQTQMLYCWTFRFIKVQLHSFNMLKN